MEGLDFSNEIFAYSLVFARIGTALMFMPTFSEKFFHARARLLLALAICVLVTPLLQASLPVLKNSLIENVFLLMGEALIGLFFGLVAKMIFLTVELAGSIISFQISLSNAFAFNPNMDSSSLVGTFFGFVAIALLFVLNMHHMLIRSLVESYHLFPAGLPLLTGDLANVMAKTLSQMFVLGMQMSAPFVVAGLLFYTALGLTARLVPQIQVFFIAMPLQIMLGFLMLTLALSATFLWFTRSFEVHYLKLFTS